MTDREIIDEVLRIFMEDDYRRNLNDNHLSLMTIVL